MAARSVIDVILGEAKGGSYEDMLAVASAIVNRANHLGVSPEEVVSAGNGSEFNAYGKALPPGVGAYRDQATMAFRQADNGFPSHSGQFYATPAAAGNLPGGLQQVGSTAGHNFYSDPQGRAIRTAQGFKRPSPDRVLPNTAPMPTPRPQNESLAMALAPSEPTLPAVDAVNNMAGGGSPEQGLKLAYALGGAKRNQPPASGIEYKVAQAAQSVDPSLTTQLFSGQEPQGRSPVGSPFRHPEGFAGDFKFLGQDGNPISDPVRLQDIAMKMAADHKANIGYANNGSYMGPSSMHIDTMPLGQYPGGPQWGNTAGGDWAKTLNYARETGVGPTPYTNAPVPTPRPQPQTNPLGAMGNVTNPAPMYPTGPQYDPNAGKPSPMMPRLQPPAVPKPPVQSVGGAPSPQRFGRPNMPQPSANPQTYSNVGNFPQAPAPRPEMAGGPAPTPEMAGGNAIKQAMKSVAGMEQPAVMRAAPELAMSNPDAINYTMRQAGGNAMSPGQAFDDFKLNLGKLDFKKPGGPGGLFSFLGGLF